MKKVIVSLFVVLMFATTVSAQVKTYQKVSEDETMVVNASDCVDRQGQNYLLWVRYDYSSPKVCMKAAKRDGAYGKAVRAEVLYEFDDVVLTYRIISRKYFDKDDRVLKEIHYYQAPWNQIGDIDYSLKLGIYMSGAFNIAVG